MKGAAEAALERIERNHPVLARIGSESDDTFDPMQIVTDAVDTERLSQVREALHGYVAAARASLADAAQDRYAEFGSLSNALREVAEESRKGQEVVESSVKLLQELESSLAARRSALERRSRGAKLAEEEAKRNASGAVAVRYALMTEEAVKNGESRSVICSLAGMSVMEGREFLEGEVRAWVDKARNLALESCVSAVLSGGEDVEDWRMFGWDVRSIDGLLDVGRAFGRHLGIGKEMVELVDGGKFGELRGRVEMWKRGKVGEICEGFVGGGGEEKRDRFLGAMFEEGVGEVLEKCNVRVSDVRLFAGVVYGLKGVWGLKSRKVVELERKMLGEVSLFAQNAGDEVGRGVEAWSGRECVEWWKKREESGDEVLMVETARKGLQALWTDLYVPAATKGLLRQTGVLVARLATAVVETGAALRSSGLEKAELAGAEIVVSVVRFREWLEVGFRALVFAALEFGVGVEEDEEEKKMVEEVVDGVVRDGMAEIHMAVEKCVADVFWLVADQVESDPNADILRGVRDVLVPVMRWTESDFAVLASAVTTRALQTAVRSADRIAGDVQRQERSLAWLADEDGPPTPTPASSAAKPDIFGLCRAFAEAGAPIEFRTSEDDPANPLPYCNIPTETHNVSIDTIAAEALAGHGANPLRALRSLLETIRTNPQRYK